MPEPLLPKFPTQFTPEDEQRLRELEEQRKAMQAAYQSKFSGQAWEGTPFWERGLREVTPPFLLPRTTSRSFAPRYLLSPPPPATPLLPCLRCH